MNTLYYGDNLDILRRYIHDETVDLVYLDPPFNSNASYNVLFHDRTGGQAAAQLQAFKDTWRWEEAAPTYQELILLPGPLGDALRAFGQLLPAGGLLAYLVMMAPRLAELRRVLKPTGSLYLHCDPTASHYLKVLLDAIFGAENYTNEISWKRTTTKSDYRQGALNWPRIHDVILHYRRDIHSGGIFHQPFAPYSDEYLASFYKYRDPDGRAYTLDKLTAPGSGTRGHPQYELLGVTRYWVYGKERMQQLLEQGRIVQTRPGTVPRYKRYLDEVSGVAIGDIWHDIPPISSQAKERMGYATQKPLALLKRIIEASSNPGDLVLDPFCGCGTTIAAAQELGRRWAGIDITQAAIVTIRERLSKSLREGVDYEVVGEPVSLPDAQILADSDPYQFQWWALGLVGARPAEQKKGADQGVDGRLYFTDEAEGGKVKQVILSVKAGQRISSQYVDQLIGVLEKEQAQIGVLITMREPTGPMRAAAASAGLYTSPGWGQSYPRVQLLTIAELLAGKKIEMPPIGQVNVTFKKAPKAAGKKGRQGVLEL